MPETSSVEETTTSETTTSIAGTTTTEEESPAEVLPAPTKVIKAAGGQTLPFTGLPLWPFALGAISLTLLGLGLRRLAASSQA